MRTVIFCNECGRPLDHRNIGGLCMVCLNKSRTGKKNPFYGKKHTIKTKNIISLKSSQRKPTKKQIENTRKRMLGNLYNLGKKRTLQQRKKMSKTAKKYNVIKNIPSNIGAKRGLSTRIKISQSRVGNKNPNWKGGITRESENIRNSVKYGEWRQRIFIRDDFTCQKCGCRGSYIEAHHIIPFSILLQNAINCLPLFSVFDAAMAYSPLWDLNNGTTLCRECHSKTKKLNQYVKNTGE